MLGNMRIDADSRPQERHQIARQNDTLQAYLGTLKGPPPPSSSAEQQPR